MKDEKNSKGIIRKCKCDSVWCPQCFLYRHAPKQAKKLNQFDWKKTRALVLTVDPKLFEDPQAAFFYAKEKNVISQFINRLKKGLRVRNGGQWIQKYKPVDIGKYISFLEWHKDGRPHWHLFIENSDGQKIGADQIREFWSMGAWIREGYFKDQKHWDGISGYFEKNGYFEKDKGYQGKLPAWALDIKGLKIRRWSASNSGEKQGPYAEIELFFFYAKKASIQALFILLDVFNAFAVQEIGQWFDDRLEIIVDKNTGEILKDNTLKEEQEEISYRMRLRSCGQKTWMKISSPDNAIQGIVNIPYAEIRKAIPGQYSDGIGFIIELKQHEFDYFFDHFEKVEAFESAQNRNNLVNAMNQWHDHRIKQGHYEYQKIHG